jgi:hypothetical protein
MRYKIDAWTVVLVTSGEDKSARYHTTRHDNVFTEQMLLANPTTGDIRPNAVARRYGQNHFVFYDKGWYLIASSADVKKIN